MKSRSLDFNSTLQSHLCPIKIHYMIYNPISVHLNVCALFYNGCIFCSPESLVPRPIPLNVTHCSMLVMIVTGLENRHRYSWQMIKGRIRKPNEV